MVSCSLQHSGLLPSAVPAYFLLPPVETHLVVGFFPNKVCSAGLAFVRTIASLWVWCSVLLPRLKNADELLFSLGRCDFWGCFCFIVSLFISYKLFLSNLVLAWMKTAWKREQDWNCSYLGKRRRALLVSSLIFLCSLRETQFKLLHSSFVPSTTGFRWSGGALILPHRINVTVFVDHFHCLWACPVIVALHLQLQGFLDEAEERSFLLSSASWLGERACEGLGVFFHGDRARKLFFSSVLVYFCRSLGWAFVLVVWSKQGVSVFHTAFLGSPSWVMYRCRLEKKSLKVSEGKMQT